MPKATTKPKAKTKPKKLEPNAAFLALPKANHKKGDRLKINAEINGHKPGEIVEITEVKHEGRMFRCVFGDESEALIYANQL